MTDISLDGALLILAAVRDWRESKEMNQEYENYQKERETE